MMEDTEVAAVIERLQKRVATQTAVIEELGAALRRAADLLARYPAHDAAWRQARGAIATAESLK